ncbi:MAG: hypothetical protein ABR976_22435 [Terracidiphilus sp.]|jgi:hypothetical protein
MDFEADFIVRQWEQLIGKTAASFLRMLAPALGGARLKLRPRLLTKV